MRWNNVGWPAEELGGRRTIPNWFGYHLMPHYRFQKFPRGAARSLDSTPPSPWANKHIKDVPQRQLLRPKGTGCAARYGCATDICKWAGIYEQSRLVCQPIWEARLVRIFLSNGREKSLVTLEFLARRVELSKLSVAKRDTTDADR